MSKIRSKEIMLLRSKYKYIKECMCFWLFIHDLYGVKINEELMEKEQEAMVFQYLISNYLCFCFYSCIIWAHK